MATKKKLLQAAAGSAGGEVLDIDDVFSTYLYTGNGSTQTITNGIDLAGEGGLVWIKSRNGSNQYPWIFDTERGATKLLNTSTTWTEGTTTNSLTQFNSNGFSVGSYDDVNNNAEKFASWTFRKAPKFFDVVTYTGTGSAQNISHNLGSVPGCVVFKRTDVATDWLVWHKNINGTDADGSIRLNTTAAKANGQPWDWDGVTDTYFPIISDWTEVNASGGTYVAYLFAHNNGDGDFGPNSDQDIIKCGSYTGNGDSSGTNTIELGFEPQWLLIKRYDGTGDWFLMDVMRGMNDNVGAHLDANTANLESSSGTTAIMARPTGFSLHTGSNFNGSNDDFIYIAIRRGPLAEPTSATDVFEANSPAGTSSTSFKSGNTSGSLFTDFVIAKPRITVAGINWPSSSRLNQKLLYTNLNVAEGGAAAQFIGFDTQSGINWNSDWITTADSEYLTYHWKRAPNFFDVVAYTGNGTAGRTVSHNLGVAPEMMWVKRRDGGTNSWLVYHKDVGNTAGLILNGTNASITGTIYWNDTTPTNSVFSLGTSTSVNGSGNTYIAYLFATLAGISKVGGFTGTAATQTIDCGFSSGARFVLIKETNTTGGWMVFDTERGIVSGGDARLELDDNGAESTSFDILDPHSSGFQLPSSSFVNASGRECIFYAIA